MPLTTSLLNCVACSLKTAAATKQEQARLEVENAEDDLVQKTEVAITLMKAILENVRIIFSSPLFVKLKLFICLVARAHQELE